MTAALDAIRARDARVPEEFWAAVARDEDGLMVAVQDRHDLLAALDRAEAVMVAARDVDGMWNGEEGEVIRWLPESAECLEDLRAALRAYDGAGE